MKNVKKFILEQVATKNLDLDKAKGFLDELEVTSDTTAIENRDIAVIGMSGVFPKSSDLSEFWENLREGINCIDEFPENRKKDGLHLFTTPAYTEYLFGEAIDPANVDNIFAPAGYLSETDKFDSEFFGIPPSEANYMDPCQRLVLESAWHAIEDAGYGGTTIYGSDTGVFLGKESTNFSLYRFASEPNPTQLTGSWESVIGSRISYLFDFKGPCMLVDTACSASLVSVHMAAQSILNGECEMALAGGVNLIPGELKDEHLSVMSMESVESDTGVVRTFDAKANGTVWGEGVGVVLLKSLKQARRDGDNIHAVIKGSAINNDGASSGLTAPNAEAQEAVILKAWKNADINPESLDYIEAHGTGTVLGDPIELKGLASAFRKSTNRKQFCAIGSLKTNMGHLVASSGIASLFKVIKSIQAQKIAPTINFNQPNPYINFLDSPLYVSDKLQDWPETETPRRAGINSFGFSHTNCHMVVEEAPVLTSSSTQRQQQCFTVSAKKKELLLDYVNKYKEYCTNEQWDISDLCYTSSVGRGHYEHRLCILAKNKAELIAKLNSSADVVIGDVAEVDGICYGSYSMVSERKKHRAQGEISDAERRKITEEVSRLIVASAQPGVDLDMEQLSRKYCQGAEIDWKLIYAGERRIRQSQPAYPFERVRRWNTPKKTKVLTQSTKLHPLIDRQVKCTETEFVYESVFSVDSHWILADHKIKNNSIVPGTTYLEMARAVASHALFYSRVKITDVVFIQPLQVLSDEARTVRTCLIKTKDTFKFKVESRELYDEVETDWILHAEAEVSELLVDSSTVDIPVDLAEVKSSALAFREHYQIAADTGVFQFGPHWDSIRQTWTTMDKSLAKLVLPSQFSRELAELRIHPAMLDNAMNLTSQDGESTYLPFMYKSLKLYRPFTTELYSLIDAHNHINDGSETHSYDVRITDSDGAVIAEIEGYITKKVNSFDFKSSSKKTNTVLKTDWKKLNVSETSSLYDTSSSILLIGLGGDPITALAEDMQKRGLAVNTVDLNDYTDSHYGIQQNGLISELNFHLMFESIQMEKVDAVVFAADFDIDDAFAGYMQDSALFEQRRSRGLDALFYLSRKLIQGNYRLPGGLVVLSRNGYRVSDTDSGTNPLGVASTVFAKVLDEESPGLNCVAMDVSQSCMSGSVAAALEYLSPHLITCLRGDDLYVQELCEVELPLQREFVYEDDDVYLITGGLGGLGLQAVRHIADRARANIVLLGRSDFPPEEQWKSESVKDDSPYAATCKTLLNLSADVKSINYRSVDIADAEALNLIADEINREIGKVKGVFHIAGVAGDGFVMNKEFSTFNEVVRPKLDGTRNLLEAFGGEALRFIAMYSSITGVVGGQGQSDYAAANAFMDAVANSQLPCSDRIYSINWPGWEDVGMALDFNIDHADSPFLPIHSSAAMAFFDRFVVSQENRLLPAGVNAPVLSTMLDEIPLVLSENILNQLGKIDSSALKYEVQIENLEITGKNTSELSVTETALSKLYAGVLGISEIDIFASFQDMGGNSILAMHLFKVINKYFPDRVEITDIFTHPSVETMAAFIVSGEGARQPDDTLEVAMTQPEIESWGVQIESGASSTSASEQLM